MKKKESAFAGIAGNGPKAGGPAPGARAAARSRVQRVHRAGVSAPRTLTRAHTLLCLKAIYL